MIQENSENNKHRINGESNNSTYNIERGCQYHGPSKRNEISKKNVECSASKYNRCFMTRLSMIVTCILNAWETKINLLALAVSREHESKFVIAKQYWVKSIKLSNACLSLRLS